MSSSNIRLNEEINNKTSFHLDSFLSKSSYHEIQDNIVYKYFEEKHIRKLFDFMVQHLIINEPDNPIEYLKDLTNKLLLWRSGTVSFAPQLFERRHVEAIYKSLDPADQGGISIEQYHTGFRTVMLTNYVRFPPINENHLVDKEVFVQNVLSGLNENLMKLVRPPFHNLCELTILPDKSYDVLFKEYPTTKADSSQITMDGNQVKNESSENSCDSNDSCVILQPKLEDDVSIESDASLNSDDISITDLEAYDFLEENIPPMEYRMSNISASKVGIKDGKVGANAISLLANPTSVNDLSLI